MRVMYECIDSPRDACACVEPVSRLDVESGKLGEQSGGRGGGDADARRRVILKVRSLRQSTSRTCTVQERSVCHVCTFTVYVGWLCMFPLLHLTSGRKKNSLHQKVTMFLKVYVCIRNSN
jgi:hypothetical protein